MKRVLCVIFAVLILCASVVPTFAANPKISVKTASSAAVGDTIYVTVVLSSGSGLGAIDFTVNFNIEYFQLISGSAEATNIFMADTNEAENGIRYAGASASEVNSGGTLLSFKLKVLKPKGKISISVNEAVDGNDKIVTSSVSRGSATVNCSHAKAKWVLVKKATCTEKGSEKINCSCGYEATREVDKAAHKYGSWVVEKEATETEKGMKYAICSACNHKKEQVIPVITTTTATTTEATTKEEATDKVTEPTTAPTVDIVEKSSTPKIVAITVLVVLGIEALGLAIFYIIKKQKQSK